MISLFFETIKTYLFIFVVIIGVIMLACLIMILIFATVEMIKAIKER